MANKPIGKGLLGLDLSIQVLQAYKNQWRHQGPFFCPKAIKAIQTQNFHITQIYFLKPRNELPYNSNLSYV